MCQERVDMRHCKRCTLSQHYLNWLDLKSLEVEKMWMNMVQ